MELEPKIMVLVDLADGQPPVPCNTVREAEFFVTLWRTFRGDSGALERIRKLAHDRYSG